MIFHPNLFIVGAPRSGTTSLYNYLNTHPEVFMCPIKEPAFFGIHRISLREYLMLFQEVQNERYIGEASTNCLSSFCAPQEIKRFNPDAKIIICVREPVALLESYYNYNVFMGVETNPIEQVVTSDKYLPFTNFVNPIRRYKELFDPNVHLILFDDLKADSEAVYSHLLDFLGLESTLPSTFQPHNPSMGVKSGRLNRFLRSKGIMKRMLAVILPRRVRSKLRGKLIQQNISSEKTL